MPPLTPDSCQKLAAYLEFQRALGVTQVRIQPLVSAPHSARLDAAGQGGAVVAATRPGEGRGGVPMPGPAPINETLEQIQHDLGLDCRRCKLHRGRQHIVFGDGPAQAELVFVGEGPGADEDAQGRPFVGRGGQLLNDMIQKGMGLRRDQVYICNVVKCRPPGNRTPEGDEIASCSPFLLRQLAAIRPRMVCALGATAAQLLRPYKGALGSVRGTIHSLRLGGAGDAGFETGLVIT